MEEKRSRQAFRLATKHYWQETVRNWKTSFPGLFLTGFGTIFVVYIPPLIIAKLISEYSNKGIPELTQLIPYIIAFGGLWFMGELMWRFAIFLLIKAETRGVENLYNNAMKYMLEKDLAFFHDNFAGSLTKKTVGYANRYIDVMDNLLFNVSPNVVPLFFICFVLWMFSPWLVVGLLGMVTLVLVIITPLIRKRHKLVTARETSSNIVSGYVSDVYSNIDAVRSFANEKFEIVNHKSNVRDYANKLKKSWDYQNLPIDMTISPFYVLTNLIGLIIALHIARSTGASIEIVFVTFSYYALFTRFMWEFNGIYRRLETSLSDAAQFAELLVEDPGLVDVDNPKKITSNKGLIEFRNVSFQHHDNNDDAELFESLDLTINAGEKIGLVGHSGGGKTTLTKLILRFMDVDEGRILIDGQDISKVRQSELRGHIAYVPQDPYLFHRSIADNIRYGRQNANDKDIAEASKLSHSDEFVEQLPSKYNTLIGERGVKLSGGQRQRIAIARAMIRNAPILLLDEATSALDSESERLIQDALWKLMEDKTAIVIAHRLSTIQKMDRILVLENGEIVEEGSHKELLKNDGVYAELWKHQSGGFIEE